MKPTLIEIAATLLFGLAILHTFSVQGIRQFSHRYKKGSGRESILHLLGEVEVVFGIWAALLIALIAVHSGTNEAIRYLEARPFTEPAFVFVIMAIAGSRPIHRLADRTIQLFAKCLPIQESLAYFVAALFFGPLLGSLITEPAAMTVTAVLLRQHFFRKNITTRLKYATLGALFVNISIGGTLTHFAAPPVVMVAAKWNWDSWFMLTQFGWKAAIAMAITAIGTALAFRNEIATVALPSPTEQNKTERVVPLPLILLHVIFLAAVVLTSHHMTVFVAIFLFYIGLTAVTRSHQDDLQLRGPLLVGFFLAGLVVLGGFQNWWLEPLLTGLSDTTLFVGAAFLTAFTDNAALTYLAAQIPEVTATFKYSLVSGAVAGGGLTLIANAPNPAGYEILKNSFGENGVSPGGLAVAALPGTFVALLAFYFL